MDDKIIFLPSNAKSDYYENTITKFKTKLATPIYLEGDYEIGLSSISYTKSWDLKTYDGALHLVAYDKEAKFIYIENFIDIPIKKSSDITTLVELINQEIRYRMMEGDISYTLPSFKIHEKFGRIEMVAGRKNGGLVMFKFSDNLGKMLGFDKDVLDRYIIEIEKKYQDSLQKTLSSFKKFQDDIRKGWTPKDFAEDEQHIFSSIPFNYNPDLQNLYIYCDIIKPNFVGNEVSPLLRIIGVPQNSKFREEVRENFIDIHYHQLNTNEISSIEINIKDENNKPVPFQFGRTLIELHLRKKWNT